MKRIRVQSSSCSSFLLNISPAHFSFPCGLMYLLLNVTALLGLAGTESVFVCLRINRAASRQACKQVKRHFTSLGLMSLKASRLGFMLYISGRFLKVNETGHGRQEHSTIYIMELLQLKNIEAKSINCINRWVFSLFENFTERKQPLWFSYSLLN